MNVGAATTSSGGRRRDAMWPAATLRTDEELSLERRVSWLELFFDLAFVVIIARLAHDVSAHPDGRHVLDFVLLFAAVYWVWNAFTYYTERFESGGLEHRTFTFAAMSAAASLAVWAEDGLGANAAGFVVALLAARAVNMLQWSRAARHVPAFRPVTIGFVSGWLLSAALLIVSVGLDGGERRVVFAAAIIIDILTPVFTLRYQSHLPRLSTSKFPERFGLFTILVLGETVVGVVNGLSDVNHAGGLGAIELIDGAFGLMIGIGVWWVYFDFVARRPPRAGLGATLGWVYLHLATLAAIAIIGSSVAAMLAREASGAVPEAAGRLLGLGTAAALFGLGLLQLTLHRRPDEPTGFVAGPGLAVGAAAVLTALMWTPLVQHHTALLGACVIALSVPAIYGVIVWYAPSNSQRLDQEVAPS